MASLLTTTGTPRECWTFSNALGRFQVRLVDCKAYCVESRSVEYYSAFYIKRFPDDKYASGDNWVEYAPKGILESIIRIYGER